jgi:uncharacterized repeat protein (TIGR01451 family)
MRAVRRLSQLLLFGVLVTLLLPAGVWAAGTRSGTPISNTATIDYEVGGVVQADHPSATADFVVDHKVRPLVGSASNITVVPGSIGQYLTFTVTNDGNTDKDGSGNAITLALRLTYEAATTDDFDMTSVKIYQDDGNGALDTSADTDITSSPIISLTHDASATIFVVGDTPATVSNSQTSLYHLIATAWDTGSNAALAKDSDGDNSSAVEVVWADDAGSATGDGQYDGKHSASGTFTVQTATLTVTKSAAVQEDPVNGATNPLAIPGARVRYTLTVTNNGGAAAQSVAIVDPVPTDTSFYVGSVSGDATATFSDDGGTNYDHTPTPDTGGHGEDSSVTHVRIALNSDVAAGGGSATVSFDVLIK